MTTPDERAEALYRQKPDLYLGMYKIVREPPTIAEVAAAIREAEAEAIAAEREQCCRDVCDMCAEPDSLTFDAETERWYHRDNSGLLWNCEASPIRARSEQRRDE
jgi:hypothetical protein